MSYANLKSCHKNTKKHYQYPIDILLNKGLITALQHKTALNLRFLYHLRFGNLLKVKTMNFSCANNNHYPIEFLEEKSALYKKIVASFTNQKILNLIFNIAVFDMFPRSLLKSAASISANSFSNAMLNTLELDDFRSGLDDISKILAKQLKKVKKT
jgi:hypothetical protein